MGVGVGEVRGGAEVRGGGGRVSREAGVGVGGCGVLAHAQYVKIVVGRGGVVVVVSDGPVR